MSTEVSIKKAWFFAILASAYFFLEFFARVSPSTFVFDLSRDFQVNPVHVGKMASIYFYTFIFLQIPIGLLIDRWGIRLVMTVAAFLFAMGSLAFSFSYTWILLDGSRLLMGLGAAASLIGALKVITRFFPEKARGLPVGLTAVWGVLGAFTSQMILPYTLESLGWRYDMWIIGLIGLGFTFCFWFFFPKESKKRAAAAVSLPWNVVLKKLHLPFVGLLGLYAGLVNAPTVAFASLWGIPYLMKAYHLSSMSASKIVSFVWIGQILGGSVVGWLCDRFNHRMLLLLGALGAFLSMWFIIDPHFQNMPLLILCMMTLGIFCSSNYIAFAIVAKYMPQEVTGLASGIVSTLNIALGTLLQLIISLLVGNLIQDKMEVLVLTKSTLLLPLIGVPIFLLLGMFVAFLIRVNRSLKAS